MGTGKLVRLGGSKGVLCDSSRKRSSMEIGTADITKDPLRYAARILNDSSVVIKDKN